MSKDLSHQLNRDLRAFVADAAQACRHFSHFRECEDGLRGALAAYDASFNVAIVGRVSEGKSTLMNALVGEPIAPTGASETTATINVFQYGSGSPLIKYRDGREETVAEDLLKRWVGTSPETLELIKNTRCINQFRETRALDGMRLVDTPGTESGIGEHEDVVREFLCEAAAIVYVTSYPGRAEDMPTLQKQNGQEGTSRGINSLCLVHKWESDLELVKSVDPLPALLERSGELKRDLRGSVQVVLPVSGALALCVRHASDEWWLDLLALCNSMNREELEFALEDEDLWPIDGSCATLRKDTKHFLNWNTFKLIVLQILHHRLNEINQTRAHFLHLSGIEALEKLIKEKFFGRQSLIKTEQMRKLTEDFLDWAMQQLSNDIKLAENGARILAEVEKLPSVPSADRHWLVEEIKRLQNLHALQLEAQNIFDRKWIRIKNRLEDTRLNTLVMETILDDDARTIEVSDRKLIEEAILFPSKRLTESSRNRLEQLNTEYRSKASLSPKRKERELFEHICNCISNALQTS